MVDSARVLEKNNLDAKKASETHIQPNEKVEEKGKGKKLFPLQD